MCSKRLRSGVPTCSEDQITVPPGFLSRTSFVLKRLENEEGGDIDTVDAVDRFVSEIMSDPVAIFDSESAKASLARMPSVSLNRFSRQTEGNPADSCLRESVAQRFPSSHEVSAKSETPESLDFDFAPVFHPSDEEFRNILKYIASICPVAERYGLCRIVPPSSWVPPRLLEDKIRFEAGPEFTMESFRKHANDIMRQCLSEGSKVMDTDMKDNGISEHQDDLVAEVERKYWHPVEGSNGHVKAMRNGFPFLIGADVARDSVEYSDMDSEWNMKNLFELPFSLLPFGCYGSSETSVPKLFIGACFASQFWKIEDHHLYSLSYMHIGEPKIWYGIPGRYLFRFSEVARKHFPRLSKHPKSFDELDVRISPSALLSEGIPVYKCVQNPTDFILIFPGAFRYDIDCGFNCTERACFAPFEWLPHGQNIVELYTEYGVRTSISQDKLLLRAATEAIKAEWDSITKTNNSHRWRSVTGKDGMLTKLLKSRMRIEAVRRKHLSDHRLEHKPFDDDDDDESIVKRECCVCFYDLYLSAVRCSCSPDRYSCLRHSNRLCSCAWIGKRFLSRRSMAELDLVVLALEGNLSAVHACAAAAAGRSRSENVSSSTDSPRFCREIEDVILIDDDDDD